MSRRIFRDTKITLLREGKAQDCPVGTGRTDGKEDFLRKMRVCERVFVASLSESLPVSGKSGNQISLEVAHLQENIRLKP